jgi:hypothetical protein
MHNPEAWGLEVSVKRAILLLGLTAAVCGTEALALELDPNIRAKAIAATAPVADQKVANQTLQQLQLPDLQGGVDANGRTLTGACALRSELCYDPKEGRVVLKSTRNWMPEIRGLTAEHIAVRRDRIDFRYSFK